MKFIAKTLEGLEQTLADELADLGAEDITVLKRAVLFSGNLVMLYRSNLMLRTCLRILVFVKEFNVNSEEDLYAEIKKTPWEDYLTLDDTFAVDSVVSSERFRHANYMALKAKDALVDRFREKYGSRPNVDTKDPSLRINIHIRNTTATLSLDSSGSSLHMRNYRKRVTEAPLNEVLAAGLVLLSGWDKKTTFIDPFCGSGTILCEAARIAANIPPQDPDRDFGFKKWKNYDPVLYQMVVDEAMSGVNTSEMPQILGFDSDTRATEYAIINIETAKLSDRIKVGQMDFFYQEGYEEAFLIFNPPYDERLREKDICDFYSNIGDKLKHAFKGCTAWILSGHLEAMKHIGLKPSRKINLLNGSIPSLFARYDLYAGSKKQKWVEKYGDQQN